MLSIRLGDINIQDSHMSIFVPIRKNDQHREGHTSIISRTRKVPCPVSITERLIALLPLTACSRSSPVVRRIVKTKKQPERFHETLGISYSTALDNLRKFLAPFVSSVSDFGTHSLKSGAAVPVIQRLRKLILS